MSHLPRLLILLALLFAVSTTAQPRVTQSPSLVGSASVSGQVNVDSRPVTGITMLLRYGSFGGRRIPGHSPGSVAGRTITDSQGIYRFGNLAGGDYVVTPFNPLLPVVDANLRNSPGGEPVTVDEGESIEGIDFSLTPGALIWGRVTLPNGRPAIESDVELLCLDTAQRLPEPARGSERQPELTDDRGVYRFYGLAPGRYIVVVSKRAKGGAIDAVTYFPGVTGRDQAGVIKLALGQQATADIVIGPSQRTYQASGQVVDEQGNPVANVLYVCYDAQSNGRIFGSNRADANDRTDADGRFRVDGLPPGTHAVMVIPGASSTLLSDPVPFEIESSNINGLTITAHESASISGVAVVEGAGSDQSSAAQLSDAQLIAFGAGPLATRPSRDR